MPLTLQQFAAKIELHPFACVRVGKLMERFKTNEAKAKFSGFLPHYAMAGCPLVEWSGDTPIAVANGAQIEMHFEEAIESFPAGSTNWIPYNPLRQGTLLQLTYGKNGTTPTLGAYRVLREAGVILNRVKADGRKIFMVAYPFLSPGAMGAVVGRFALLGLFSLEGEPIFLAPEALQHGIFKSEWPTGQKERSVEGTAAAPPPAPTTDDWFARLTKTLAPFVPANVLNDAVIKARGQELVDRGAAPTIEAGQALAAAERAAAAPQPLAPTAPAAGAKKAAGKKLLGK